MSQDERAEYHSQRAMRELNLGLTAGSPAAARAHLHLSSLHMDRARALNDSMHNPRPILVVD